MTSGIFALAAILATVPRPWTPMAVSDGKVSVWGRDYTFASNALPVSVTSLGRELLAGDVRVVCADGEGKPVAWTKHGSWVHRADDESVTVCGWCESPAVTVDAVTRIEFDGMMEVSLALVPGSAGSGSKITRAWLEIPLRPELVKYYQYYPFSWGRCENAGGVKGHRAWPFLASLWLGDEKMGFSWFCESERNFAVADEKRVVEVIPGNRETVLRVRLVDRAVELPRTWVFGLEATPVKPFDRSWNRNHVLHSPKMGAGITIKRPETWWTAQRAFPSGNVDEAIAKAAAAGVKTVAFHEDWIPIQNNPSSALADFRPLVEKCHAAGMKVIAYDGYELSPLDPEWGRHCQDWLAHNKSGLPMGGWYRQPAQRDYRSCLASGFAEKWLERAKKAYLGLGLDGYYLDGTISPWMCFNESHGCGWRDEKGTLRCTYPIFAVRKVMRELYEFVDSHGGVINAHQSGYVCPATLGFVHSYWDGEQLATGTSVNIRRELNLDAFRAEFMGRNHGVPCEFLCYPVAGRWSYDDALALTLVHDVLVRPCGFGAEAAFSALWKKLDDFGVTEADWLPYWESPLEVKPDCVKASVYRRNGRCLAVVSNLSPDRTVTAEVMLPSGARSVTLPPFRMEIVEY